MPQTEKPVTPEEISDIFLEMSKGSSAKTNEITIIVDKRELRSQVVRNLDLAGVNIVFKTLEVGDYVISSRIGLERKAEDDFFSSWLDEKKLFGQLYDLRQSYSNAALILQTDPYFSNRNVNVNAVRGVMNAITVFMQLPIVYSSNDADTAQIMILMAKKEQIERKQSISVHGKRSHMNIQERREYVVSAMTDIGPTIARNLLEELGSVEGVMTASSQRLQKINEIGPVTARQIRVLVGGKYEHSKGDNGNKRRKETDEGKGGSG